MRNVLARILNRLFPKRETKIVVVARDITRLTASEWRSQPDLVRIAREMLHDARLRSMLDVLRNQHLANGVYDLTAEERSMHLGRIEGYGMALNDLESLAVMSKPVEPVLAEFAPEESPDKP